MDFITENMNKFINIMKKEADFGCSAKTNANIEILLAAVICMGGLTVYTMEVTPFHCESKTPGSQYGEYMLMGCNFLIISILMKLKPDYERFSLSNVIAALATVVAFLTTFTYVNIPLDPVAIATQNPIIFLIVLNAFLTSLILSYELTSAN